LFTADAEFSRVSRTLLGPLCDGIRPADVVPASAWQAARSAGSYTLVGCTVGPGFDYADFEMLRDRPLERQRAIQKHPDVARLI
jgi:predicted cupin superfamily sugar epimerase